MTNLRRHILTVLALLGLSSLVQLVVIHRATTPGLDSVRFVQIAQQIDREGVPATLRCERQQPLFPVWVWAVHRGWVRLAGESPSAWAISVQLAAAVPLVLVVAPLYFAIVRLAGSAAALAGGVFFCALPEVSRLGADGISDSTHLLFFCLAFWAMVEYFRDEGAGVRDDGSGVRCQVSGIRGEGAEVWSEGNQLGVGDSSSPGWLVLAGVATGMAVLARAEVLVLALALAVTLVAFWFRGGQLRAWRRPAMAATCFGLGLAVVLLPYLATVGAWAPRTAVARILGRYEPPEAESPPAAATTAWQLDSGEPASFAAKEPSISLRRRGYPAAVVRFGRKLADAYGYWIGTLALWGAWRLHRRGTSVADRFVQIFFVLFTVVALRFSAAEGYLVPRHLLTLVAVGIGAAGYGALELTSHLQLRKSHGLAAWSLVLLAALACLPQTLIHHHDSRLGHRAAGEWLAARSPAAGSVLDTQGWTGLYSGRTTYPFEEAPVTLNDSDLAYVVFESRELQYDSRRGRTLRWLARSAERVAEFPLPDDRKPNRQPVVVLRWDPARFRRLTACRPDTRRANSTDSVTREDRHAWAIPDVPR